MKIKNNIDKLGIGGVFITVLFSPCCFPLFAFSTSALGLGSFELFGNYTKWVIQGMVAVSIIGLFISYCKHKNIYPLLIAIPSGLLILYGYYFNENNYWISFLYTGIFGLLVATAINYRNKLHGVCKTCVTNNGKSVELKSTLTCPNCGYKKDEIMPTVACQFFYECESCKFILKPKQGDCCVYCSYGTVVYPSVQKKVAVNCF